MMLKRQYARKKYTNTSPPSAPATRDEEYLRLGVSPRGSLNLMQAAKAKAYLEGRDYVIPDDVQAMVFPVLAHRMIVKPEAKLYSMDAQRILKNILNAVRVPVI